MTWRKGWTPAPASQAQFENAARLEIYAQQQDLEMYMADTLPLDFEGRKHAISEIVIAADGQYALPI